MNILKTGNIEASVASHYAFTEQEKCELSPYESIETVLETTNAQSDMRREFRQSFEMPISEGELFVLLKHKSKGYVRALYKRMREIKDGGQMDVSVKKITGLALILSIASSMACLHPPREYPGKLGSKVQEYLLYRKGDEVHLIANQRIQSSADLPSEIAWVIPVRSLPTSYFEESDSLFKELFRVTEIARRSGAMPKGEFRIHETIHVGKYEITPIEVLDTSSGLEINDWLHSNGFGKVPYEGLKYYLKRHACFLAIRVRGLSGKNTSLRPLHIVYKSNEARVPLKFFANAGVFDVYVYTISEGKNFETDNDLKAKGFVRQGHSELSQVSTLATRISGMDKAAMVVIRYFGSKINSNGNGISKWKEDPVFAID
jgi:hypothetical protein